MRRAEKYRRGASGVGPFACVPHGKQKTQALNLLMARRRWGVTRTAGLAFRMTCHVERSGLTRGRADARAQPRLPVPVGSRVPGHLAGV